MSRALQTRSMLRNVSTRARIEDGERVMVGGFIIRDNPSHNPLRVCIRGLGPTLPVSTALNDPQIQLIGPNRNDANYDWQQDTSAGDLIANGLQPADGREAAMIRSLEPGSYTVVVSSQNGQFGIGMFEIYEMEGNSNEQSRILNLSTRCLVGTGEEAAIAGTIIGDISNPDGKPDRELLIFGKGPGLQGLTDTKVYDPKIDLYQVNGTTSTWLDSNDDWRSFDDVDADPECGGTPLEDKLKEAGLAPGYSADQLRESALWPIVRPGKYTVVLQSKNGDRGIGQVEFYEY